MLFLTATCAHLAGILFFASATFNTLSTYATRNGFFFSWAVKAKRLLWCAVLLPIPLATLIVVEERVLMEKQVSSKQTAVWNPDDGTTEVVPTTETPTRTRRLAEGGMKKELSTLESPRLPSTTRSVLFSPGASRATTRTPLLRAMRQQIHRRSGGWTPAAWFGHEIDGEFEASSSSVRADLFPSKFTSTPARIRRRDDAAPPKIPRSRARDEDTSTSVGPDPESERTVSPHYQQTRRLLTTSTSSSSSSLPRLAGRVVIAYFSWLWILSLVALFFIVLHFCSLGLDAFALELVNSPVLGGLVTRFNVLNAVMRRGAYAVQLALVGYTTVAFGLMFVILHHILQQEASSSEAEKTSEGGQQVGGGQAQAGDSSTAVVEFLSRDEKTFIAGA